MKRTENDDDDNIIKRAAAAVRYRRQRSHSPSETHNVDVAS